MFGGRIGFMELLVILGIALLFFGNKLPTMGKSLGEGIRNFKKGLGGGDDESKSKEEAAVPTQNQSASSKQDQGAQQVLAQTVRPAPLSSSASDNQSSTVSAKNKNTSNVIDAEHSDSHKS